jgi:DNA-binding MarR family transcriptional regulator
MNALRTDVDSADTLDIVASWDAIAMGFAHTQRRLLAAIEAEGLHGPSFEALRLLLASDDHRLPMSRLARDLTMTAGGLTKLADRLARDGLIDRRNSSDDRRVVYAALTEKGAELAARTLEIYRDGLREHVLNVLSPAKLAELAEVMSTLDVLHADAVSSDEQVLAAPRDPALPERRARQR